MIDNPGSVSSGDSTTSSDEDDERAEELERVAVDDHYRYWTSAPPEQSARCCYWVRQYERGWRPNNRIRTMGYDNTAGWYGVYMWEYLHVLYPLEARFGVTGQETTG